MASTPTHSIDTLADDFRTAMTLQVPAAGSTGRLSNSDMGDSDMQDSDSWSSSRGGSERGPAPKISIVRLGDERGIDLQTAGSSGAAGTSMATMSNSSSAMSVGRSEGAPGIMILPLDDEDEEQKAQKPKQSTSQQSSIDVASLPTITMEEVVKHKTKDDCWTVVDDLVFDVTSYVPYHPGGKKILLGAGKEASQIFHQKHPGVDLPTSKIARLCIGRLCQDGEEMTYRAPKTRFSSANFLGAGLFF